MKKRLFLASALVFMLASTSIHAQIYKTYSDTVNLNKEYVKVSNDIAELTSQLTIAQNKLPGYQSKANATASDAQDAAISSSKQASRATNGSVKEARKAKRQAKRSYKEAKDARSATADVGNQDDKITRLTSDLSKKQLRKDELDAMRTAIYALPPQLYNESCGYRYAAHVPDQAKNTPKRIPQKLTMLKNQV